jgi:hypothetical protein
LFSRPRPDFVPRVSTYKNVQTCVITSMLASTAPAHR